MFKYKRETLFLHENVKNLDLLDEGVVEDYYSIYLEVLELKNLLDSELKNQSRFYFKIGEIEKSREIVRFRREIKRNKISKMPMSLTEEARKIAYSFRSKMKEKNDIKQFIVEKIFNNKIDYDFFLSDPRFQKAIIYTNPKAYPQIFDKETFYKKKYDKTRYSYIQRNILKTNSLSWMGVTTFKNEKQTLLKENFYLNRDFLTALLFLGAKDVKIQKHLKFKIGTASELDGYPCFIHNRYYSNKFSNSFLVKEDVLFNHQLVNFLKKVEDINLTGVTHIKKILDSEGIDLEFVLNNNLVVPDFEYYDSEVKLKELFNCSDRFNKISEQIFNKENVTNLVQLNDNLRSNLVELDSYYFERPLIEIVEEEPIWQESVCKENNSKFLSIFDTNFSKYEDLLNCVRVNDQYMEIMSWAKKIAEDSSRNVLEIFLKIESEMIYQNHYWDDSTQVEPLSIEPCDLEGKSLMIMFNVTKDNEAIITNVFPGNGFLLGREFNKMSEDTFSMCDSFLSEQHPDDSQIFEVVITPEISPLINTGQSRYPQLFWPRDFKNVKIHFQGKKISFTYKGKKIIPVYFGSIPIHFFSGTIGLFLKSISPWVMAKDVKESIKQINDREEFLITKSSVNSIFKGNAKQSYLDLLLYFQEKKLPLKFFLQEETGKISKPIFITLLSIEGFELFKKITNRNDVIISALSPRYKDARPGEKLYEYINIITEKEIKNYVDKLSYL